MNINFPNIKAAQANNIDIKKIICQDQVVWYKPGEYTEIYVNVPAGATAEQKTINILNQSTNSITELYINNEICTLPSVSVNDIMNGSVTINLLTEPIVTNIENTSGYIYEMPEGTNKIRIKGEFSLLGSTCNITDIKLQNKLTSLRLAFFLTTGITTLPSMSTWDLSEVINMQGVFYSSSIQSVDFSGCNLTKVEDMSYAFAGCMSLTDINLINIDTYNVVNFEAMFHSCIALTELDVTMFDTINCKNFSLMFNSCQSLTALDLSNFNTSNATNVSYIFEGCSLLTTMDLTNFDFTNVTDCQMMFDGCLALTSVTFPEKAPAPKLQRIYGIFYDCVNLTSVTLPFESQVTDARVMFYGCSKLSQADISKLNLDTVKVSQVINTSGVGTGESTMNEMFAHCIKLTTVTQNVIDTLQDITYNAKGLFTDCVSIDCSNTNGFEYFEDKVGTNGLPDQLTYMNIPSKFGGLGGGGDYSVIKVEIPTGTTKNITVNNQLANSITKLNKLNVNDVTYTPDRTSSYDINTLDIETNTSAALVSILGTGTLEEYNLYIINGETTLTEDEYQDYLASKEIETLDLDYETDETNELSEDTSYDDQIEILAISNTTYTLQPGVNYIQVKGACNFKDSTCNIIDAHVENGLTIYNNLFSGCTTITELNSVKYWDTSKVTTFASMFYNCSSLKTIRQALHWNTSLVNTLLASFSGCKVLESLEGLQNWDVSNVTTMRDTFFNCLLISDLSPLSNWKLTSNKSLFSTFCSCKSLTSLLPLKNWNTSIVIEFNNCFFKCEKLTSLDGLQNWDVSSAINICDMFNTCTSLSDISQISSWRPTKCTNYGSMFSKCYSLTSVKLSNLVNTLNVSNVNLSNMFFNCEKLTDISGLSGWNVSNVTNMIGLFQHCVVLENLLPISDWDISNNISLENTFRETAITNTDDLSNWVTTSLGKLVYTFYGCSKLTDITGISNWDVSNVTRLTGCFSGCVLLVNILPLGKWDLTNCTIFYEIFGNTSITTLGNPNATTKEEKGLAAWADVIKPTNLSRVFYMCKKLTDISALKDFKTETVTEIAYLFYKCNLITDFSSISGWDISNVNNMSYFVGECNINSLDIISNWDFRSVDNMDSAFSKTNITTADLTLFKNLNPMNVSNLFDGCLNLTTVNLTNNTNNNTGLNTLNLTTITSMFRNCGLTTSITGVENLITENVQNITSLFENCKSLKLPINNLNWNFSGLTANNGHQNAFVNLGKNITLAPEEKADLDLTGCGVIPSNGFLKVFSGSYFTSIKVNVDTTALYNNNNDHRSAFSECPNLTSLTVSGAWGSI